MTAFSLFGAAAFLGAIIAVHWIYFRTFFSDDTRLVIKLPSVVPGVEHFMIFPAALGDVHLGANVWSRSMVADDIRAGCDTVKNRETMAADDFDLAATDLRIELATAGVLARPQPGKVLVRPLDLRVGPLSSLAPTADRFDCHASTAFDGGNRSGDRVIMDEKHLVLEGIITEAALVCWGDVEIRAGAVIGACMKVRGNLHVGANVTFLGSVVVNGDIRTGESCVFLLDVVTKGRMTVGEGTIFGRNALWTKPARS
jgi:hypothetical protein